jgi:hypothetical protein
MADNFHFDLTGVPLDKSLEIAFMGAPGNRTYGWAEIPVDPTNKSHEAVWGASKTGKRLVFYWSTTVNMNPFPAPLSYEDVVPFVKAWLKAADYGQQPDQDGDNGKGCRVYNEAWGHVAGDHYAFVAIEPVWLMYGK